MVNKKTVIKSFFIAMMVTLPVHLIAQTFPVSSVNISIPNAPDANTANWAVGKPQFLIKATAQGTAGAIDPAVVDSRILVIIKKDGKKICGAYSSSSAPAAGFNRQNMAWKGSEAIALLGQECTLAPGDYVLSVQFFGNYNGKAVPLSREATKPFSIPGSTPPDQPVQNTPGIDNGADDTSNKPGGVVSLQIGGLGNLVFGAFKKKEIYCGKIKSDTKIACAGIKPGGSLPYYNIIMTLTNIPVDQAKSCNFVLNTVTALSKGTISAEPEKSPKTIAPNATITYSFKYTPASLREENAKFNISGAWNGDAATPLELKPVLKLPPCTNCDCGSWTPLAVNQTLKFDCGDKTVIPWKCNQPFNFSSVYQCSQGVADCLAKTNWVVKKDGVTLQTGEGENAIAGTFTPAGNGTYTVTLNADCNGIQCPPCTYTISVQNCPACNCGEWASLIVNSAVKYESGSGNVISWKCGNPFSFTSVYHCGQGVQNCRPQTSWEIDKDGLSIKTGSGNIDIADAFTPTGNGTYTITLNASCNGIKCPPATYTIAVEDCKTCDCGSWPGAAVDVRANDALVSTLKCGESTALASGAYNFAIPAFVCSSNVGSCVVSYAWSISGGRVDVSGATQKFRYNFGRPGVYTLTITPSCSGKVCRSCTVIINVGGPVPPLTPPNIVIIPPGTPSIPPGTIAVQGGNLPPKQNKPKKQAPGRPVFYYAIRPEYSGEVVNVKDTLFIQVENNYASGSNQFTYTIQNLANNNISKATRLDIKNNQGLIRMALPLQNSGISKGQTGLLIMGDYKKYYYISFKRN